MSYVLAVDDSVSLRKLIAVTLTSAGHEVVEASNGSDALNALNPLNALKNRKFDLIITDLNMPVMDGLTLIGKVRALAAYKFTPILVLTTEMDAGKKQQAKQSGASGWLVKPFDPDRLLATIRKVLA